MRRANPIENTGVIIRKSDGFILGSCFLFRYIDTFLTAAHCIEETPLDDLAIALPNSRTRRIFDVRTIERHPSADAAILRVPGIGEREVTWIVYLVADDRGLGLECVSYGFPRATFEADVQVMPRLYRGYVQRFFDYTSGEGYRYHAVELNFACPVGLSGSAIFNQALPGRLYGIVTANIEVSTEQSSISEVDDDGRRFTESVRNVVRYGIGLWLPAINDWLDSNVPPIDNGEMSRRSANQRLWEAEENG